MRLNLVPPLLNTKDLSRLFGVRPRTILAWCARGKLKPVRIGRQLLFREADIASLLGEETSARDDDQVTPLTAVHRPRGDSRR